MRYVYVYDDTMQDEMVKIFEDFMDYGNVGDYYSYEWGMNRISVEDVKNALEKKLNEKDFYFGNITNSHQYEIYYQPKGAEERQIVGLMNLKSSPYNDMFASCVNCDGEAISDSYDIYPND